MYYINLTVAEIKKIKWLREKHPHHRVRRKLQTLWLKHKGYSYPEISKIIGVSLNTVRSYLMSYIQGGLEALMELNFYRPQSELMFYKDLLEKEFENNSPATLKEAKHRIKELTGLDRSLPQVSQFLKKLGLRRLKVGSVPSKADPVAQETFKKKS